MRMKAICCMCGKDRNVEGDSVLVLQSKITGNNLCETCSTSTVGYFALLRENFAKALVESVLAPSDTDENGDCTCPKCILNRMMETAVNDEREANAPSTHTRQ